MTFTFKLARRLARLRPPSACLQLFTPAVVFVAACAATDATDPAEIPTRTDATVTLVVTPGDLALDPNQSAQFSAHGLTAEGDTTAPAVSWRATGGAISASGAFTATAAGSYHIAAETADGRLADTARVVVGGVAVPPGATLMEISIAPDTATLAPGEARQFAATGRYSDGRTDSVAVAYSATGGSVTSGGLLTAGASPGTYRVVAHQAGGILSDTAIVTVAAAAPPPGLTGECTHPRAGWIWCDDFEQDRLASYFEHVDDGGSFVRAGGVGAEGSYGMRARFAAGQVSAGALHLAFGKTPQAYFRPVDAGTTIYRELYWRLYVRHEAGWTGGGGDKLSRVISFASPTSWAQAMKGAVWSGGQPATHDFLAIDPISGTDEAGNLTSTGYNDFENQRYLGADHGTTPMFGSGHLGQWYCVEARVKLNDAGASDGVFELWIDGALEARRSDLNWVGAFSEYGMNAVFVENYWNDGSPKAQERYIDNFVVSTSRIGC